MGGITNNETLPSSELNASNRLAWDAFLFGNAMKIANCATVLLQLGNMLEVAFKPGYKKLTVLCIIYAHVSKFCVATTAQSITSGV